MSYFVPTFYGGHDSGLTDHEARRRFAKTMRGSMHAQLRGLNRAFDRATREMYRELPSRPLAVLLRLWIGPTRSWPRLRGGPKFGR